MRFSVGQIICQMATDGHWNVSDVVVQTSIFFNSAYSHWLLQGHMISHMISHNKTVFLRKS